eukprot:5414601-Prymnesium_polylepis.1
METGRLVGSTVVQYGGRPALHAGAAAAPAPSVESRHSLASSDSTRRLHLGVDLAAVLASEHIAVTYDIVAGRLQCVASAGSADIYLADNHSRSTALCIDTALTRRRLETCGLYSRLKRSDRDRESFTGR